jgi:peptidoglycan hydrolase-like protein with peptidoglycan-binding domain
MRRMTRRLTVLTTTITMALAIVAPTALANHEPPFSGTEHQFGEIVEYPMVFPVAGVNRYSSSFWASRSGGIHHGIDIMADKMTPVVAIADGVVTYYNGSGNPAWIEKYGKCCTLRITHEGGWVSKYIHLNNDTPGTDDGQGWGIAPGIDVGVEVKAGQLIGWVGDSGNAEGTAPHLHFELMDHEGAIVDPYEALRAAQTGNPVAVCRPPDSGALDTLLATTGLIKRDARGTAVMELQRFLTAIGYDTGAVDGVFGNLTLGAVRAFQEGRGLNPDGVVGPTTRSHIAQVYRVMPAMPVLDDAGRIIRPGARGGDVQNLQKLLAVAGYDPGSADGVYGAKTEAAVAAFQKAYGGLTVDGKIGPSTRDALAAVLGLGEFKACG